VGEEVVRMLLGQRILNRLSILQIAFDEFRPRIDRCPMAFAQIVERGDSVPVVEQNLGANAADVARSADDQNLHRASCGALPRRVKANCAGPLRLSARAP